MFLHSVLFLSICANFLPVVLLTPLSAAERATILACHNSFRSSLARGQAQNKAGLMPPGANIVQLKYDTGIEAIAENWANQCTMAHSTTTQRQGTGENLFMTTSTTISNTAALQQACQMWWEELKQFGLQASLQLSISEFNKGIGHWSQMAWANTAKVGCSVARCPNSPQWKTYIVCNYSPSGNYLNQNVYQRGTACSACGSRATCDSTTALCDIS